MIKYADRLPLGQTIQRAISSEGNAHSQSWCQRSSNTVSR
jgi:hypothetical protein